MCEWISIRDRMPEIEHEWSRYWDDAGGLEKDMEDKPPKDTGQENLKWEDGHWWWLSNISVEVLVATIYDEIYMGSYFGEGSFWQVGDSTLDPDEVSHWMPLPDLPNST